MMHPAAVLTSVEVHREARARPAAHLTVRQGDTLSGIAARYRIEWQGLYQANRSVVGTDPNLLNVGERLRVPSAANAVRLAALYQPGAVAAAAPQPVSAQPVSAQPATVQPVAAAPATQPAATQQQAPAPAAVTQPAASTGASGSFQSCVISRESGGNAQVTNGSGHYGLYQFSYPLWVASGGSPGSFGNASAATQNQVFASAYAKYGSTPWAPYDGC